jgi:hypothetical protein
VDGVFAGKIGGKVLEQITVGQFLQWLTVGGGIAIILQRLPFWEKLPGSVKFAVVAVLNFAAPALLAAFKVYVPPATLDATIGSLIFGAFALAASFIIHKIDEILTSLGIIIAGKALTYLEQ